jgi:integrase
MRELGLMPPGIMRLDAIRRRDPEARAAHEEAVQRRRDRIAEPARERGTRWCLYHFRHSFAPRMLEAGTDALTLSALLRHADGAMLAKVYSHPSKNGPHLRSAVQAGGIQHECRGVTSPERSS